jgi:hypothetical protein
MTCVSRTARTPIQPDLLPLHVLADEMTLSGLNRSIGRSVRTATDSAPSCRSSVKGTNGRMAEAAAPSSERSATNLSGLMRSRPAGGLRWIHAEIAVVTRLRSSPLGCRLSRGSIVGSPDEGVFDTESQRVEVSERQAEGDDDEHPREDDCRQVKPTPPSSHGLSPPWSRRLRTRFAHHARRGARRWVVDLGSCSVLDRRAVSVRSAHRGPAAGD